MDVEDWETDVLLELDITELVTCELLFEVETILIEVDGSFPREHPAISIRGNKIMTNFFIITILIEIKFINKMQALTKMLKIYILMVE